MLNSGWFADLEARMKDDRIASAEDREKQIEEEQAEQATAAVGCDSLCEELEAKMREKSDQSDPHHSGDSKDFAVHFPSFSSQEVLPWPPKGCFRRRCRGQLSQLFEICMLWFSSRAVAISSVSVFLFMTSQQYLNIFNAWILGPDVGCRASQDTAPPATEALTVLFGNSYCKMWRALLGTSMLRTQNILSRNKRFRTNPISSSWEIHGAKDPLERDWHSDQEKSERNDEKRE